MSRSGDRTTATAEGGGWAGAPRPRVVVSACLEFEACRFDGQVIRARFLRTLAEHVELLPVCPEVEIGLGTPRAPIRLLAGPEGTRLFQPASGRDLTEPMTEFAAAFLEPLSEVDGFLLKSRSPSCGPKDVRVYGEAGAPVGRRDAGFFAAAVAERFPDLPREDEGRLTNRALRHHFFTRIFQGARLRALPSAHQELVRFHASSKLLLLAHSEAEMRSLGRVVANHDRLPEHEVAARYRLGFLRALARRPRAGGLVNALQHAFGHISEHLEPAERAVFVAAVESFAGGRSSLDAPLALLRGWNARYGFHWLAEQTFLAPYPAALQALSDSGSGEARSA